MREHVLDLCVIPAQAGVGSLCHSRERGNPEEGKDFQDGTMNPRNDNHPARDIRPAITRIGQAAGMESEVVTEGKGLGERRGRRRSPVQTRYGRL